MTKPSEVTVTDAEAYAVCEAVGLNFESVRGEQMRQALAAFLAARVPDAVTDQGDDSYQSFGVWEAGHNALRDAVLKGPQT